MPVATNRIQRGCNILQISHLVKNFVAGCSSKVNLSGDNGNVIMSRCECRPAGSGLVLMHFARLRFDLGGSLHKQWNRATESYV
jgi:hypothetical protein